MITVLIADNNIEASLQFSNFLTKEKNIKVLNIAQDGEETITSYLTYHPDILILDVDMPKMNGVEVLNYLCEYTPEEKNKCNIILISGCLERYPLKNTSKVYRVLSKPFDLDSLVKTVYEVYDALHYEANLETSVRSTLSALNFNLYSFGAKYLIESIVLTKNDANLLFSMDKVYKEIGQKNNTPPQRVKWDIETSINSMYRYSDKATIQKIFPLYDGRKPTPKYLLSLFSDKFEL